MCTQVPLHLAPENGEWDSDQTQPLPPVRVWLRSEKIDCRQYEVNYAS